MIKLHIDIETYSSVDLTKSGVYKYAESVDFEILMLCYAFDDDEVVSVDLYNGERLPLELIEAFHNPEVIKCAHNANFERICLRAIGYNIPIDQWRCTAILAGYCGLPMSLDGVTKALDAGDYAKSATGKALIRYFSCPVKPTKKNGFQTRNFPTDSIENMNKWQDYLEYCIQDVVAERWIDHTLDAYEPSPYEWENYYLDQEINDRGVLIDHTLAISATRIDAEFSTKSMQKMRDLTGLSNPNSPAQLKSWLNGTDKELEVTSLGKEHLQKLKRNVSGTILEVLNLREQNSKTSTKKYVAMLNCQGHDGRARGLFQHYGANRTGRTAGRLIQLQNLAQNKISNLDDVRKLVRSGDYEGMEMTYDNIPTLLSQLIRTAIVAPAGKTFAVCDFSAIEARVLSWLAGEKWRMDVFATHGKIYEASASMMFNIPLESITKGSVYRDRGKVAELALGYGGGLGAMKNMGGEKMGLSDVEMTNIVKLWRKANPKIVECWYEIEDAALRATIGKMKVDTGYKGISFESDGYILKCNLPAGRHLSYFEPKIRTNRHGNKALFYKGMDQIKKTWVDVDTYGGKLIENIIQALSRDVLFTSMQRLKSEGFDICMHVHDEVVAEVEQHAGESLLDYMGLVMAKPIDWAPGLIMTADGYTTDYYKKD